MRLLPAAAAAVTASVSLTAPAVAGAETHTVSSGDTLWDLAQRYRTTINDLARLNNLSNPDQLRLGQVLTLPSVSTVPTAAPTPSATPTSYRVVSGDTLYGIARRFGVSFDELTHLNDITNPNLLPVGMLLALPKPTTTSGGGGGGAAPPPAVTQYTVQSGDTLWSIANRLGVTVTSLASANGLTNPDLLRIGQVLTTVGGGASPAPTGGGTSTSSPTTYTVQAGDTLWSIANRFGLSVNALGAANGLGNPDLLRIGQVLTLVGGGGGGGTTSAPSGVTDTSASGVPRSLFGSRASDAQLQALVPVLNRWADANRLPRDLFKALTYLESGWNNQAVSSVGALGLGQLMPDTASFVNSVLLGGTHLDPKVPEDNARMSARYLRYLLDQTGGDENTALASYYQGLGAVRRYGLYSDTVQYVRNIQALRVNFA